MKFQITQTEKGAQATNVEVLVSEEDDADERGEVEGATMPTCGSVLIGSDNSAGLNTNQPRNYTNYPMLICYIAMV